MWHTLKYERLYLKSFDSGIELSRELSSWFSWYNNVRPHQSLKKRTPDQVYFAGLPEKKAA